MFRNHHDKPLTPEQKHTILEMSFHGHSILSIAKHLDIHGAAIYYEFERDPEFHLEVQKHREYANDHLLDALLTITDGCKDKIDVLKARLKSQNILATVTMRNPKKYAPKLQVDHNVMVDLSPLLRAGEARLQLDKVSNQLDKASKTETIDLTKTVVKLEKVASVASAAIETPDATGVTSSEDLWKLL